MPASRPAPTPSSLPCHAVLLALFLSSAHVHATAASDSGFYLGAASGRSKTFLTNLKIQTDADVRYRDTAWQLYAGYRLNRWLAWQLDYADLGKLRATSTRLWSSLHTSGWGLSAVLSVPVSSRLAVFVKGGRFRKHTRVDEEYVYPYVGIVRYQRDRQHWTHVLGVGADYRLSDSLALRLEYQEIGRTPIASRSQARSSSNMSMLGLHYRF